MHCLHRPVRRRPVCLALLLGAKLSIVAAAATFGRTGTQLNRRMMMLLGAGNPVTAMTGQEDGPVGVRSHPLQRRSALFSAITRYGKHSAVVRPAERATAAPGSAKCASRSQPRAMAESTSGMRPGRVWPAGLPAPATIAPQKTITAPTNRICVPQRISPRSTIRAGPGPR